MYKAPCRRIDYTGLFIMVGRNLTYHLSMLLTNERVFCDFIKFLGIWNHGNIWGEVEYNILSVFPPG